MTLAVSRPPPTLRALGVATGVVNVAYIAWLLARGPLGSRSLAIPPGGFGGFSVGEVLLILNSLLAVGLLWGQRRRMAPPARNLLSGLTAALLVGMWFATASNAQVHARVLAYHAIWHLLSAFGFVLLWALNHVRFQRAKDL